MKNKLFISIYCGLMILLASCNNYLDVKPKGKIIPETAEDFSTIIHYWLDQIEKGRYHSQSRSNDNFRDVCR